jgi:hypothetical protein
VEEFVLVEKVADESGQMLSGVAALEQDVIFEL